MVYYEWRVDRSSVSLQFLLDQVLISNIIIQQIVTLSKYGHDSLNICHP